MFNLTKTLRHCGRAHGRPGGGQGGGSCPPGALPWKNCLH